MKKTWVVLFFSFSHFFISAQEKICSEIKLPQLTEAIKKEYEQKRVDAESVYVKDKSNADAIIWYGRRTAYLGNYQESLDIFSEGIVLHPRDARLYRHRGHRYITVRCFDKAIEDLKKAAKLIKGKPDETEPDGLPNAKNIPTSTLQTNIWYHLGLAYYVKGNYRKAERAYTECLAVSENPDMYVAAANWLYISLLKLNRTGKAEKLLATIKTDEALLESGDYLKILLLYKKQHDVTGPVNEIENSSTLSSATYGFGLGNYLLLKGEKEKAKSVFQKVVNGNQWSSFGFIAAETALTGLQ